MTNEKGKLVCDICGKEVTEVWMFGFYSDLDSDVEYCLECFREADEDEV